MHNNEQTITEETRADKLSLVANLLTQAENLLEDIGMPYELDRLCAVTDEIINERDYIIDTEFPQVMPRAVVGIFKPANYRR